MKDLHFESQGRLHCGQSYDWTTVGIIKQATVSLHSESNAFWLAGKLGYFSGHIDGRKRLGRDYSLSTSVLGLMYATDWETDDDELTILPRFTWIRHKDCDMIISIIRGECPMDVLP